MYTMGFYMLPKGSHAKMDTIRSKFFWQGAGDTFKYHMAKWISMCKPKIHGGLGIINTYLMNQCLITKWIWKIEKGSNELWYRILKAKYLKKVVSSTQLVWALLNSGGVYTRLSISLSGDLSIMCIRVIG